LPLEWEETAGLEALAGKYIPSIIYVPTLSPAKASSPAFTKQCGTVTCANTTKFLGSHAMWVRFDNFWKVVKSVSMVLISPTLHHYQFLEET
jgi:hypothetical protein